MSRFDESARRVSTGTLPAGPTVQRLLTEAHEHCAPLDDGTVSTVYPALARAPRDRFGLALAGVDGAVHEVGHSRVEFTIMSVSKPFLFALACAEQGIDAVREAVGVDATGLPFSSLEAVERPPAGLTNPMVNPGAIATTALLLPGATAAERWESIRDGLSRFAGRTLDVDEETYASASRSTFRNRAIADLLRSLGTLAGDPDEAVDLYTRQCCLAVTAVDLAVMGATLADGGVHPVTGERVVDAESARAALAVMVVAGVYERSGSWLLDVGMPAKSGIAGGLVTVSPGKGALGAWSPPLDDAGTSVRGARAAQMLARHLGLDLLASRPADR